VSKRFDLSAGISDELLGNPLCFDTNVWLFINGPFVDIRDRRYTIYSGLFSKALKAGADIYLPQVVVGEFVGVSIHYQLMHSKIPKPKKVHHHPEYVDWIKEISDDLFHISDACKQVDDCFSKRDLDKCMALSSGGGIDFNDVLLVSLCREMGFTLVTDDGDYAGQDLDIATSNKRILNA